jgi:hypothetical protein
MSAVVKRGPLFCCGLVPRVDHLFGLPLLSREAVPSWQCALRWKGLALRRWFSCHAVTHMCAQIPCASCSNLKLEYWTAYRHRLQISTAAPAQRIEDQRCTDQNEYA